MKHFGTGLLLAAVVLAMTAPGAQALSAYGTWWKTSDDNAFGITLRHRQSITPLFAVDGRAGWLSFSDTQADVFPLEVTGLVTLGMFYGGPGIGYYIFTGDADFDNAVGYHLIGGVGLGLGPLGVYGEVKYGILKPDYKLPGGGTSEADLDHFAVHGGVVLGF